MPSLKDLLAQRAALEAQIAETQASERANAVAKVKSLMEDYGLTLADLAVKAGARKTTKSSVAAKYRNQATGETWSGRGLQPKWLKAAIAGGATLDQFKI
ncbi:H-NS family nucleoid-associated regulatory protein [Roseateles sp. LYH14W]|uniref:H-NS family nucleoid-associated regulatory protein n=1 Tax=Pelomonas parva TaxID=3299032 RepID=A0ABW7FBX6_9BURK